MTLTPQSFIRSGLLVVLVVVVQLAGLDQMHMLGGVFDLIPLVVAASALYAGAISGAVIGFCVGLLVDLLIGQSLGATSLVLTAMGYWVGRFGELRDPGHGLVAIPIAAATTAGYLATLAAVTFMLDIQVSVSVLVLRDAVITVLLNIAIALPFFAITRRVLRPALKVDPLARARRSAAPRDAGPIGLRGLEV
ncbi:MAG: rod shape-determining protein MreD [Actinobacteria bacterium]|nr:rod shape-determining protein MreD [Actinomycetota bacterium]